MKTTSTFVASLLIIIAVAHADTKWDHTWTLLDGNRLQGDIVDLQDAVVRFKATDGTINTIPLRDFLYSDQDIIRNRVNAFHGWLDRFSRYYKTQSARASEFESFLAQFRKGFPPNKILTIEEQKELLAYIRGFPSEPEKDSIEKKLCEMYGMGSGR